MSTYLEKKIELPDTLLERHEDSAINILVGKYTQCLQSQQPHHCTLNVSHV